MKRTALLLVLTLVSLCSAQDIRSKVRSDIPAEETSNLIDPDSGVYGIPYGTSEDELIAKFGMPTGYISLSPGETAMIYGTSRAFLFSGKKLVGIRITDSLLDWKLSSNMSDRSPCDARDGARWRLNNGIKDGMTLPEVKNILGQRLSGDKYQSYFETSASRVELDFAQYTEEGNTEMAYKVRGLLVRKR